MNCDVLECKREAIKITTPKNLPINENGQRKGHNQVMKDLWDDKGYVHYGLAGQNLRDQASRLEKMQDSSSDIINESCEALESEEHKENLDNISAEVFMQHANLAANMNLHTTKQYNSLRD